MPVTAPAMKEAGAHPHARFRVGDREAYGIVERDRVRELAGDLFGGYRTTDRTHALADVELLVPTQARQVFALAGNYLSHMTADEVPERFKIPQPFLKTIGSLVPHGHPIVIPHDASDNVHYESAPRNQRPHNAARAEPSLSRALRRRRNGSPRA